MLSVCRLGGELFYGDGGWTQIQAHQTGAGYLRLGILDVCDVTFSFWHLLCVALVCEAKSNTLRGRVQLRLECRDIYLLIVGHSFSAGFQRDSSLLAPLATWGPSQDRKP